jgi:hypothetical protein
MPKDKNGSVKRFNVQKNHKDFGKTANYDFEKQMDPSARMGSSDFANMPSQVMVKSFSRSHDKRSGVINNFACGIEDESHIDENRLAE